LGAGCTVFGGHAGIDFGLDENEDLLLFEANAAMLVNPPEPDQPWAYRGPAVERIFAAVRRMLTAHLAASTESQFYIAEPPET
jgi:hypothetical protein